MQWPSGTDWCSTVGDVVGHGVEAAAVMSQLRTALRMQITAGHTIVEALEAVDDFHEQVPGSKSATICVGSLDLATGEFQYCTAGHPPPLLVRGRCKRAICGTVGRAARWAAAPDFRYAPRSSTSATPSCCTATA